MSVKKVINTLIVDNFGYDKVSVDNFYPKSLYISDIYRENKILCCKETNSPIVDNFLDHSQPPNYLLIRELQ